MKKLMFAAAALTAGFAMAEVVSPDVVGYAQSGLKQGATMVAPQFIPVTGTGISLNSLVPTGSDTSDNVSIRVLDAAGRTVDGMDYAWNDWMYGYGCWVDADYNEITDVSFPAGQGLWVYGSATDQGLQSAGKVGTDDVVVSLRPGGTATGNPYPVTVNLNDILAEGSDTSDNVSIRVLDAAGRTVDGMDYAWNDWMYGYGCWIDADYNEITDVSFPAGQGLWVYGSSVSQAIRFPAPEL